MRIRAAAARHGALHALRAAALLLPAACTTLDRAPRSAAEIQDVAPPPLAGLRYWAEQPPPALLAPARGAAAEARDHTVLALSGGGPDGAFGVGVLSGWSRLGTRPEFDVVTGVSTGALIAPFAFLGPGKDALLLELYTGPHLDVLLSGGPLALLTQPGLYRQAALRALIDRHVTDALLEEIAAEDRRGRRLLVTTANLDAQRVTVWNMGAIAGSAAPGRLALFRDILAAAISVPVLFPPVPIAVQADAAPVLEMHGDASLLAGFHAGAEIFPPGCGATKGCRLYVLVHNKLLPEERTIPWRITEIGKRAAESMVKANLMLSLEAARAATQRRGALFRMAYLDSGDPGVSPIDFDRAYMRRLVAYGAGRVAESGFWRDLPQLAAMPADAATALRP